MKVWILDSNQSDVEKALKMFKVLTIDALGFFYFSEIVDKFLQDKPDILFLNIELAGQLITQGVNLEQVYMIAMADNPEPEYLKLAIDLNMKDLLIKPLEEKNIRAVLEKARKSMAFGYDSPYFMPLIRFGKVICFFSCCEKIGQTLVAYNSAMKMAQDVEKRVCYISFGDLDKKVIFFDENIFREEPIDILGVKKYNVDKLDVIILPLIITNDTQNLFSTISKIKRNYDYLILDLPKKFSESVNIVLNVATKVYFLVSLAKKNLKLEKQAIAQLKTFNFSEESLHIIISSYGFEADFTKKNAEELFQHKIDLFIQEEKNTVDVAFSLGKAFITCFPQSLLSQKLEVLTNGMVSD